MLLENFPRTSCGLRITSLIICPFAITSLASSAFIVLILPLSWLCPGSLSHSSRNSATANFCAGDGSYALSAPRSTVDLPRFFMYSYQSCAVTMLNRLVPRMDLSTPILNPRFKSASLAILSFNFLPLLSTPSWSIADCKRRFLQSIILDGGFSDMGSKSSLASRKSSLSSLSSSTKVSFMSLPMPSPNPVRVSSARGFESSSLS